MNWLLRNYPVTGSVWLVVVLLMTLYPAGWFR